MKISFFLYKEGREERMVGRKEERRKGGKTEEKEGRKGGSKKGREEVKGRRKEIRNEGLKEGGRNGG